MNNNFIIISKFNLSS